MCTHIKRDLCIWKETFQEIYACENKHTKETCAYEKKDVYIWKGACQKDLCVQKETYKRDIQKWPLHMNKRRIYMKIDLSKGPIHMKTSFFGRILFICTHKRLTFQKSRTKAYKKRPLNKLFLIHRVVYISTESCKRDLCTRTETYKRDQCK